MADFSLEKDFAGSMRAGLCWAALHLLLDFDADRVDFIRQFASMIVICSLLY